MLPNFPDKDESEEKREKSLRELTGLRNPDSRLAEEALLQSEQRYKSIVDNITIGIAVISPEMEILSLNR